jgi:hypothetical protein
MYNTNFELTIDDIDLIEKALHSELQKLSLTDNETVTNSARTLEKINKIQDLLGRIHNQKIWYRPKQEIYVGG